MTSRWGMLLSRVPGEIYGVVVAALCLGSAWALLTPLFQVPDEPSHYAYVQYLAETGRMPAGNPGRAYSSEQDKLMNDLGTLSIIGRAQQKAPAGTSAMSAESSTDAGLSPAHGGGSTTSSSQPPLYYLLGAGAYRVAASLGPAARVRAVRMLSVMFFVATCVLAALTAGALFPTVRWARALGGISVALAPVPAFIGGGVTPDNLLMTICAGLTYGVVVGLRRPSQKAVAAVALLCGLGAVTKLTFVGLLPGCLLAIALMVARLYRRRGLASASRAACVAVACMAAPVALYVAWAWLQGRPLIPPGASTPTLPVAAIPRPNLREHLSYAWQLFLPRIPGQNDAFGFSPITETWIAGWLGRYGWLDYGPTQLVRSIGTPAMWTLAAMTLVGSALNWRSVGRSWAPLCCFTAMTLGLAATIAWAGYDYKRTTGFVFEQVRYLFPLLGLYASGVVAASLALGRRFGASLAILLMTVFGLHAASGLALTISRYYGG